MNLHLFTVQWPDDVAFADFMERFCQPHIYRATPRAKNWCRASWEQRASCWTIPPGQQSGRTRKTRIEIGARREGVGFRFMRLRVPYGRVAPHWQAVQIFGKSPNSRNKGRPERISGPFWSQTWSDMGKLSVLGEFWQFLKVRKKFWLAPILVVLLLLSLVIVLAQGSALAPFIYALF